MKIFALNLSLEFKTQTEGLNYGYEEIDISSLMAKLFKGNEFSKQQYYISAEDTDDFVNHVFDIQKNKIWRECELTLTFIFPHKNSLLNFWNKFQMLFKHIEAAGGLVENERGEYLMIYNRNRWTLPKGHVEWKEAIEDAALREVKEETGIQELEVVHKIPTTLHTFKKKKKWILKSTYWYKMSASSTQELSPEIEEDIEEVRWMSKQAWLEVATNSYPLTRELFIREFTKSLT